MDEVAGARLLLALADEGAGRNMEYDLNLYQSNDPNVWPAMAAVVRLFGQGLFLLSLSYFILLFSYINYN
jgi:hypothetical protein